VRLAVPQCIAGIIMAVGPCLGVHRIVWGEFCILIFNLYEEVSAMPVGFWDKEIIQRELQS
jgi:hypothetical protein